MIFDQILAYAAGKPVVLAANKCEGKQGDDGLMEAWRLGLGDPAPISAEHGGCDRRSIRAKVGHMQAAQQVAHDPVGGLLGLAGGAGGV